MATLKARLRVFLLTCLDSLGHCDPPFWPKFRYDDDPRLKWMVDGTVPKGLV